MAGPEKSFENRLKNWLSQQGIYALGTPIQDMHVLPIGYYEKRWGNKMSSSGLPDMHIVIKGQSIEVELKAPNGKASELQKHMIEQINKSGCDGFVMYEQSKDIPSDYFPYYCDFHSFKELVRIYANIT